MKLTLVEKIDNLFYFEFETGANFVSYFPENNIEKIVANIKAPIIPPSPSKKLFKKKKINTPKIHAEN